LPPADSRPAFGMPQVQLPVFPVGTTAITSELGFERQNQQLVYFNGHLPVFTHEVDDLGSFRFFTSQLIANGTVSQGDIAKAYGVPLVTVKRYYRLFREDGAAAFFQSRKRRTGHRLTPERLVEVQALMDEGLSVPEISKRTGLLATTLHKAIKQGRLKPSKKKLLRAQAKRPLPPRKVSAAR
jgi:transposase